MRELGPNAHHPLNELTSLPCIKNVTAYDPFLGGENGQSNQPSVCCGLDGELWLRKAELMSECMDARPTSSKLPSLAIPFQSQLIC